MPPTSVSLKDVYDIVSKVDDKLDTFISETHAHRARCATELGGLDKRVAIIEDRGVRFWAIVTGIAGLVSACIAAFVGKLLG